MLQNQGGTAPIPMIVLLNRDKENTADQAILANPLNLTVRTIKGVGSMERTETTEMTGQILMGKMSKDARGAEEYLTTKKSFLVNRIPLSEKMKTNLADLINIKEAGNPCLRKNQVFKDLMMMG